MLLNPILLAFCDSARILFNFSTSLQSNKDLLITIIDKKNVLHNWLEIRHTLVPKSSETNFTTLLVLVDVFDDIILGLFINIRNSRYTVTGLNQACLNR